ncbi:MAG: aromatic ring-hydroxylating dioxygenase subunit alpha [Gemmatimonadaceae bacterium]|nr:aromatic ring-hydroxylating dioxygenase subunit alpha [Gemmatimonadaceae bacterium]
MSFVFPFDPDITRASTIPSRCYVDPLFLALEEEKVFGRTWQLVGRREQLAEPGAFLTATIAREPIVIVRDGEQLRGFHNVCLHRAGPIAQGCGVRKTLQCRYHGWTYGLDGQLKRAPEMEGTDGFRPEEFRLMPVQVATWGPLVFAALDSKTPPLAHFLDDLPARAARFQPDAMRFVTSKRWTIACNWKVYVDNYLEGYHLPAVHPGLYKELDYDQYRVEPHRYWSLQHAPLRAAHGATDRKYVPKPGEEDAQYYWLFPNAMLNVYQGQMQTNVVLPRGPDSCEVVFEWFAAQPPENAATDPTWTRLLQFSDEIQDEDIEICEAVYTNLRSRSYDRGRYSAARENGVHHFHGLLHEFLT